MPEGSGYYTYTLKPAFGGENLLGKPSHVKQTEVDAPGYEQKTNDIT
ncbi:hypothetical protein [Pontibacter ramchanderi]|uniref:Uncharacterized protein n=1 Tax=Pontibacter ramchanderi TaxID=1179743 RepID=A0A2N3V2V0_9BACT|nr:hypothetical protein [Pontibacter ramchanderi]PKV75928.1 hypothetical protein BD749_0876 [Pontibacter ramchanderi]